MAESRTQPVLQFSAGGLVVDERGRVLLIRARDLRNQPVWTLPKGTLDPGESSADAALREVREETGYRCEVVRELDAVTYWFQRDGRRIKKTVRWFLMRPLEKVGDHDQEVDEVAWLETDEALRRLRYDSDRRLVEGLRRLGTGKSRAPFFRAICSATSTGSASSHCSASRLEVPPVSARDVTR